MRFVFGALCAIGALSTHGNIVCAGGLHASDIILSVSEGRVVTGRAVGGGDVVRERIFTGTFGDVGCDAFTANPGYDSEAGTFGSGSTIGWNSLDGLRIWDGNAFVDAEDTLIRVSFGAQSFDIANEPSGGFSLFAQTDGGFHRHVDFCMQGCPSGCLAPPGTEPGVYLVQFEVVASDGGVAASDPYWILFDYLAPAGELEDAFDWAEDNLIDATCDADIDVSGNVDFGDLVSILTAWGPCPGCVADLDGSDSVDFSDLLIVLTAWGPCS